MINLDMIGRLNEDNSLIIYGTGTSAKWKEIINMTNKDYNFKLTFNDEGYGSSDQTSFYSKKIPVLFFFTGTHTDYHRPGDTAGKINYSGEKKILNFIYNVIETINEDKQKPVYVNIPSKDKVNAGFKVYFGTIPDFSFTGKGFKINGVNEGSPAQKAGVIAGDIVINFREKPIADIYDFTNILKECKPGDIVNITVNRNGKEIKLTAVMGAK
jgi:membrane-associated protease RseP (regulator of RpoE activity)